MEENKTIENELQEDFGLEVRPNHLKKINLHEKPHLMGAKKSGKSWKQPSKKSSKIVVDSNKGLKTTWAKKMKRKEDLKIVVDQNKKFRKEKIKKIKTEETRLKEKAKRKELNTYNSSTFQIIKDTKKIKKWSKRARADLAKLPTEIFERVIKKEYNY